MGQRPRGEADSLSPSLAHEHDDESAQAMGGKTGALDPRPEGQSGESDRGGPGLERDPYRDEGGEAWVRPSGLRPRA
jgi:hypothetical protein